MATDDRPAVGELLRRARRAAGLTQEALAERAGLSMRGISDLERGVIRAPHRDTLELLAEALDLPPAERRRWEQARRPLLRQVAPATNAQLALPPLPRAVVGRARERELLQTYLEAAVAGHGRVVLLSGEAGIGKTTLVGLLSRQALECDALVLLGHCYDLASTPPYGPWLELTDQYPAGPRLPALLQALKRGTGVGELAGQLELFEVVRRFFASVSERQPLVLVLEDLHWADPASLDLLRYLARQLRRQPILVAVTYRTEEVTERHPLYPVLPLLVHESDAERLDLRELVDADVRALVDDHYQLPARDAARLAAYLVAHAEGNPLYIREVLRTLETDRLLLLEDERWILGELRPVVVPALLRNVIAGRAGRLSEETRTLLAVAAVIGQQAPIRLWSKVSTAQDDALLIAIEEAEAAHFIEASGDGTSVRFIHALIRDAFYEAIRPVRRRRWHQRVAEGLAALPQTDPDAVAHQFQQAGDPRATDWLIQAGERAYRAYAWRNAIERFDAAVRLMADDPRRARERGWLLYRSGRMLRLSAPLDGIGRLQEAEHVGRAVGDAVLTAYALFDRGLSRSWGGDPRRGIDEMVTGIEALDELPADHLHRDPSIAVWIANAQLKGHSVPSSVSRESDSLVPGNVRRSAYAVWLAIVGRHVEAITIGEACRNEFTSGAQLTEAEAGLVADAHFTLGIAYAELGRAQDAGDAFWHARETYRNVDHHVLVAAVIMNELWLVGCPYRTTDIEQRRRLADDAEAAVSTAGDALDAGLSPSIRNSLTEAFLDAGLSPSIRSSLPGAFLDGEWNDARDVFDAGRAPGITPLREWAMYVRALVAWGQGDDALAWQQVHEMLPDGPTTEPGGTAFGPSVELQRLAANLVLDQGELDRAHAWLAMYERWLAWGGTIRRQADAHLLRARYHLLAGERAPARRWAEQALAHASNPRQPLALIAAHRFLGHLDTADKRFDDAEQHLQGSLGLAEACETPFERALTLLGLAELRLAQRQIDDTTDLLDEVQEICEPLDAKPTLERVAVLRQQVTESSKKAPSYPAGLTSREVEVLRLVAEGLTDAEIADRLFISRRTVTSHLTNIYNRIGIGSRAAASVWAKEQGLI